MLNAEHTMGQKKYFEYQEVQKALTNYYLEYGKDASIEEILGSNLHFAILK